ncbi:hypothetical protein BTO09_04565 [Gilvibacter sp. SZ-19]|uniref:HTTM domain-containing protein n=1 Tax=Gilvibacter sp. SZ-19 TaxID=754429 RepID=UPI000B3D1BB8|nr:HTTM domain-containing protein [Gilvibacter sp. SZ-19]ARV11657.1 hypothetical protein BTO09_04565 [Gilvibacter sp. SZ-19]
MLDRVNNYLFTRVDNAGLVLFRIAFGFLLAVEAYGAIATGWVKRTLVEPEFTFNFIGFDFLQPLPGNGMYIYFAVMGVFGILVMLGYKYRWSMAGYALMWTCVYLMQKSSYNNHYYLMMLLTWMMVLLPAAGRMSLDAKLNPQRKSISMPRWVSVLVVGQLLIVFTYAAVAKIYPDWLDGTVTRIFMRGKAHYWLIGDFLQLPWVHLGMAYFGILFDLLVIPMYLWRKTRWLAFGLSLFFHLFNSAVFHIGIFPYMSIAFALFFFSSETLVKRFMPKEDVYQGNEVRLPKTAAFTTTALAVYLIIQFALPLRHWFIAEPVLWTEEGHRLSWRMMLRTKSGRVIYYIVDKADPNKKKIAYNYKDLLSKKQYRSFRTKPDFIWQLAQRIHQIEKDKGKDVEVYATVRIKVNAGDYHLLIDEKVDLAAVSWDHIKHNPWILPAPENFTQPRPTPSEQ